MEMFMRASQAREETKEVVSTRVDPVVEIVKNTILAAIKEGEYKCIVMENVPRSVRSMLEASGYEVSKYLDATHEPVREGWKISWEDD